MKKFIYLLIISLFSFYSCDKNKENQNVQINKLRAEVVNLKQKMIQDSTDCVSKIDTLLVQIDDEDVCSIKDYYVVVGSFREESRANIWASKIENLGYTPCIVESHNDWFMVYVKGGNDKTKALTIMENVKMFVTPNAWVYVRRK